MKSYRKELWFEVPSRRAFSISVLAFLVGIRHFNRTLHIGSFLRPLLFSFVWLLIAAFEFLMLNSETIMQRRSFLEIVAPEFHLVVGALLMFLAVLRVMASTVFVRHRWSVLIFPISLLALYGRGVLLKATIDYLHVIAGQTTIDWSMVGWVGLVCIVPMVPVYLVALFTAKSRQFAEPLPNRISNRLELVAGATAVLMLAGFGLVILTEPNFTLSAPVFMVIMMVVFAVVDWVTISSVIVLYCDAGEFSEAAFRLVRPCDEERIAIEDKPGSAAGLVWIEPKVADIRFKTAADGPHWVLMIVPGIGYRGEPYGARLLPHLCGIDAAVATLTLPGHGRKGGKALEAIPVVGELVDAIRNGVGAIKHRCPQAQVILVADSMGAAVLAGCIGSSGLRDEFKIDGVIFVVPAFGVVPTVLLAGESLRAAAVGLIRRDKAVFPLTGLLLNRALDPYWKSAHEPEDPEGWLTERRGDPRAPTHVSLHYLLAIRELARPAHAYRWGLPVPALFICGAHDPIADAHAAIQACRSWLHPRHRLVALNAGHCPWFRPDERRILAGVMVEWLEELARSTNVDHGRLDDED